MHGTASRCQPGSPPALIKLAHYRVNDQLDQAGLFAALINRPIREQPVARLAVKPAV
jgi:Na+-transporting NADH:ubiquinone oxidoreductase subunit NqrA